MSRSLFRAIRAVCACLSLALCPLASASTTTATVTAGAASASRSATVDPALPPPESWEAPLPERDADGDGLTYFEEMQRGSDPAKPDTDLDGVPDAQDGWPRHPWIKVPPLPETRYAFVPLGALGWPANHVGKSLSEDLQVVGQRKVPSGNISTTLNSQDYNPVILSLADGVLSNAVTGGGSWYSAPHGSYQPNPPPVNYPFATSNNAANDIGRVRYLYQLNLYGPDALRSHRLAEGGLQLWVEPAGPDSRRVRVRRADGTSYQLPLKDGLFDGIPYQPIGYKVQSAFPVDINQNGDILTLEFGWASTSAQPFSNGTTPTASLCRGLALHRADGSSAWVGGVELVTYRQVVGESMARGGSPGLAPFPKTYPYSMGTSETVTNMLSAQGSVIGITTSTPQTNDWQLVVWQGGAVNFLADAAGASSPPRIARLTDGLDGYPAVAVGLQSGFSSWFGYQENGQWKSASPQIWNPQTQSFVTDLNLLTVLNNRLESPHVRNGACRPLPFRLPEAWISSGAVVDINNQGVMLWNLLRVQDAAGQPLPSAQQYEEAALLLPMEILTPSDDVSGTAAPAPRLADSVLAGKPTPEIEISVEEASLGSNGALSVRVSGTVRDRLSELLSDPAGRVGSVYLRIDGVAEPVEVPLDYTPADDLFRVVDSTTHFERTLVVPEPLPRGYFVTATTAPNAAGQEAWDKALVSLGWRVRSGSLPDSEKLVLVLPGSSSPAVVDTLRAAWGGAPFPDPAPLFTETTPDSGIYLGVLPTDGRDCSAELRISPATNFGAAAVDVLEVRLVYTDPVTGRSHRRTGLWHESAAASLRFEPDDLMWSGREMQVHVVEDLPGSHVRHPEPLIMRLGVTSSLIATGAQVRVNGHTFPIKELTVAGQPGVYVVADAASTRPRVFLPGETALPAELAVADASAEGDELVWELLLHGQAFEMDRTPVVPETPPDDGQALAAMLAGLPRWAQAGGGAGGGATAPPPIDGQDWRQPGDTVSLRDLKTAYAFIYPDDFSTILLSTYESLGHGISLEDVLGDQDVEYANGHFTIRLENDDDDINPAVAAQLLYNGLNEAFSTSFAVKDAVTNAAEQRGLLTQSIETWRANAMSAAGKHCGAAAELYLAAIGIVNEGADWAMVINDVSEGHYTSLAAALPFVPVGVMKVTKLKNLSGETLQGAMDAERWIRIQNLYTIPNLAQRLHVANQTVLNDPQMLETVRRILTGPGGPVKIGDRSILGRRMEKLKPRPGANYRCHHDLPYQFRDQFEEIGIDINDPAFGRWAKLEDHVRWHNHSNPKYNEFWENWLRLQSPHPPTKQQVLEKLAEARLLYLPQP